MSQGNTRTVEVDEEVTCEACNDTGRDIVDDEYCGCEMGLMLEEVECEEESEGN